MKKNLIVTAIAAASAFAAFAPVAHAADGEITFTGNIIAQTCTVNGGGASNDFIVTLPPVSTAALATAGSVAGRTPFSIKLTNCAGDSNQVSTFFAAGATTNQNTGGLMVDAGIDKASNVEIRLLNDTLGAIKAGAAASSQNSQVATIAGGAANLNYFAEYESLGNATAGAANSRVQYTMIYQ